MNKYKSILNTNLSDLNLYQCGREKCSAGHTQGPASRPYYLLHYVISGKGYFASDDASYQLQQGSAFLMSPHQTCVYRADETHPWEYVWVAFDGIKADGYLRRAGLSRSTPVYRAKQPQAVRDALLRLVQETQSVVSETRLMGYFYLFLAALTDHTTSNPKPFADTKEAYLQTCISYIEQNYRHNITVDDLAKHVGLNRSYLCSVFKEKRGLSPQQFIIRFRLEAACDMLVKTSLPIAHIARLTGYTDQLTFSRMFKNKKGLSPTAYRTLHRQPALQPQEEGHMSQ